MMKFAEVQALIPGVDLSRDVVVYRDEMIVNEVVPDVEMSLEGGQKYLVDMATKKVQMVGSSILDWPSWYLDDKESEITLI